MKTVDAVSKHEIDMVKTVLENKYGQLYSDIWKVGVNVSLRIGDLLSLKYEQLNLTDRSLVLVEAKTGKHKNIRLNSTAVDIINRRRRENPDDEWLFQVHCNRAKGKPVSRTSVSRVFKEAGDRLGLTISTHSMRKSRGMALYNDGVAIEKIAKVLNHSNTSSTLRYLGITNKEILATYDQYEL
ncbi:MAG: integrase [Comamonadaceae bacterium]|nr:MAG: integrase [Comamonadaceae bacterium]